MHKPRRRNSLLRDQALVFLAIILIGVLVISVLYNTATIRYYRGQTTDMAGAVLRQAEASLEDKTEQYRHIMDMICLNTQVQDLLFDEYYTDVPRIIARTALVNFLAPMNQNLSDLYGDVRAITFYVANETLGEEPGDIVYLGNAQKEPWVAVMQQQKSDRLLWLTSADGEGNLIFSAIRPMRNFRISRFPSNFLGYLKIDFNMGEYFQNVLKATDSTVEWMLITDDSGKAVVSTLDGQTQAAADAVAGLRHGDGWQAIRLGGHSFLTSGKLIDGMGWTCWYAVSEVSLFATAFRQVNVPVLLLTIAMTVAMALAAWYAASRLARRIGNLAAAMGSLEQGRFDIHLEDKGSDEIAFLAAGFNDMAARLEEYVRREYRDRMQQKEYDLQALQAQLHPHFLYNTLASISWLGMQSGSEDIPAISNALARFYRLSLSRGRNIILVSDEADQVRAYLDVMAIRYRGRINPLFRISAEVSDAWTLKLILQPFVENALLHGLHVLKNHINLIISAERDGDALVWKVIDDGMGMPAEDIPQPDDDNPASAGYGIANVHRRIRMYFGQEYGVRIAGGEGIGMAVMIRMPLLREKPQMQ